MCSKNLLPEHFTIWIFRCFEIFRNVYIFREIKFIPINDGRIKEQYCFDSCVIFVAWDFGFEFVGKFAGIVRNETFGMPNSNWISQCEKMPFTKNHQPKRWASAFDEVKVKVNWANQYFEWVEIAWYRVDNTSNAVYYQTTIVDFVGRSVGWCVIFEGQIKSLMQNHKLQY